VGGGWDYSITFADTPAIECHITLELLGKNLEGKDWGLMETKSIISSRRKPLNTSRSNKNISEGIYFTLAWNKSPK
jgi:hypothetical protein